MKKSVKVSKKYLLRSSPSNTPYMTSTGIQIGKYYQPPKYVEEDSDMLRLQSYLIGDPAINAFAIILNVNPMRNNPRKKTITRANQRATVQAKSQRVSNNVFIVAPMMVV